MITSFAVGAIFSIEDRASPVLERLAVQVRELDTLVTRVTAQMAEMGKGVRLGGLTTRITALNREMKTLADSTGAFVGSMTAGIGDLNTQLAATVGLMRGLAADTAAAARSARDIGIGGAVASGAGRGAGRHGGGLGSGIGVGLGERSAGPFRVYGHPSGVGMLGFGALAAAGYGAYEEAQIEDITARAMLTIPGAAMGDRALFQQRRDQMRSMIQDIAAKSGYSPEEVGDAMLTGIRQFAGMPYDQRMKNMPGLLIAAAAEARIKGKGTSLEQSAETMTGLAHMFQAYDPAKQAALYNAFAYISTVDPEALPRISRAASYAIPRTRIMDADPMQELLLVGVMQRAGIVNTKSGTWLSAMIQRAMPGTSLISRVAYKKHEKELRMLGLVDDKGQPTWFTDDRPDIIKLLKIGHENLAHIPLAQRGALAAALFGQQGAGAFGLLADPVIYNQIVQLSKELPQFRTGLPIFEALSKDSPAQQFRMAWSDFQNVAMDIGTKTLPPLTAALMSFDDVLKALAGDTTKVPGVADMLKHAATAGATAGLGTLALTKSPMAAGVAFGVGAGAAVFADAARSSAAHGQRSALSIMFDPRPEMRDFATGVESGWKSLTSSIWPAVTGAPPATPQKTAAVPPVVNLTNNIVVKGDWDGLRDLAKRVAAELAGILNFGIGSSQGSAHGTAASPYASGKPVGG